MPTIIIKDGIAVYTDATLTEQGTIFDEKFDPTTRKDNAIEVQVAALPADFNVGKYCWDGNKLIPNVNWIDTGSIGNPDSELTLSEIADKKIAEIDAATSASIQAGFDHVVDGVNYHFSYDMFDQQNFSDSANVVNLLQAGVEGLPESTPWNAYKNWTPETGGELVQLTLTATSFIQLYVAGAMAHKSAKMAAGTARKNAVLVALANHASAEEILAL